MGSQRWTRTSNNPATRIAQPGQSGHTVLGFEISLPIKLGTRYDDAIVRHTTINVERLTENRLPSRMRPLDLLIALSHPEAEPFEESLPGYSNANVRYYTKNPIDFCTRASYIGSKN
jgi:hypothetical protein